MPVLRYRDVPAEIDWLCRALGFERLHVATAEDGGIQFAQVAFGGNAVMLSPLRASGDGERADTSAVGEATSCYFLVQDADAHFATAKAAGAEIIMDIGPFEHGGRGYSCRDPEGHVWTFGTYDPWHTLQSGRKRPLRRAMIGGLLATILLLLMGAAAIGWVVGSSQRTAASVASANEAVASEQRAKSAADLANRYAAELATLQGAKVAAEHSLEETRNTLAREESRRASIERDAQTMQQQLAAEIEQLRAAKDSALESATMLRGQLAREEDARKSAERSAHTTEEQLEQLRRAAAAAPPNEGAARALDEPSKATAAPPTTGTTVEAPRAPDTAEQGEAKAEKTREGEVTQDPERKAAGPTRASANAAAPEKPARAAKRPLTQRERQLLAARAKARCRALFPDSPCE
jgi:uncharacterized glyoxalase superfamily protein PhnB